MTRRGLILVPAAAWAARSPFDDAFEFVKTTTKHGGLVVHRRGRPLFERYFGRAHAEARPNLASVGKAFTSIAAGILMSERQDLRLDTRVFDKRYLPPEAFPLSDERKARIQLGQLLTMTSGLRGNSPGAVLGKPVPIDPPGPDGWQAMVDETALACDLWCDPGAGYSYATAGVHLVSIVVRRLAGMELQQYLDAKLAKPLGWGEWGFGYKRPEIRHTPGGGGIQLRAADVMRFGQMLLQQGRWEGKRVVPQEYVRMCGAASPFNPHSPYSLQFDVNAGGHVAGAPRDAFWKTGSGGHCLYIVPSLELAIWKLGGRDDQYGPGDKDDGSRAGFRASAVPPNSAARTLEMVVAAAER